MASPQPLLIADVPWLLYRAFFALPSSIVDDEGHPVNALLGTVNALLSVLDEQPARAVVACFGAEQATYRVRLYPPYHAHRDPMPVDLQGQFSQAPQLLKSLGWTVCDAGELEADDAIYSHALAEARAGGEALLLTGDRDLYGAVSERVKVLELAKGRIAARLGIAQVRERYGVAPEQVPDFIALRGDPSDGLPGAPGIGAKTAAELLSRHDTLEGVLDAAGAPAPSAARGRAGSGTGSGSDTGPSDAELATRAVRAAQQMRPRIAESLRENAEQLRAFREIATLQKVRVRRPADRPTNYAAGSRSARELGMNRLAERLERLQQSAGARVGSAAKG